MALCDLLIIYIFDKALVLSYSDNDLDGSSSHILNLTSLGGLSVTNFVQSSVYPAYCPPAILTYCIFLINILFRENIKY